VFLKFFSTTEKNAGLFLIYSSFISVARTP